jgi:hypothetical protein
MHTPVVLIGDVETDAAAVQIWKKRLDKEKRLQELPAATDTDHR